MDALSAWLFPVVVAVVGPWLTWALSRTLGLGVGPSSTGAERPSVRLPLGLLEATLVGLTFAASLHVVGPELVPTEGAWPAQALALVSGMLALGAAAHAQRLLLGEDALGVTTHMLVGGALLVATAAATRLGPWPALPVVGIVIGLSSVGLMFASLRPRRGQPTSAGASAATLVLALALAGAAWAGAATALMVTAIADEDVPSCGASRARTRIRVSPWDGSARLALAWEARRTEHLDQAEEHAAEAVRLGADAATTLDFYAELAAAHGDCTESYARFESALRIRAAQAFAGVLERPLELGESALPPTYVRDCLEVPE